MMTPPIVDTTGRGNEAVNASGAAVWGPTSRLVPQWSRPGATPVETLGRNGEQH